MQNKNNVYRRSILTIALSAVVVIAALIALIVILTSNGNNTSNQDITIYFVRHAKTDANEAGLLAGRGVDAKLTDEGKLMAVKTGEYLSDVTFDKAYATELLRTQETAKIILSQNKNKTPDITIIPLLNDISWGEVEGLTHSQAVAKYPDFGEDKYLGTVDDDSFVSPIGATTKSEIVRDYDKALKQIVDDMSAGQTALAVGHSSFVWFLNAHFPEQVSKDSVLPNASVTILRFTQGKWVLEKLAITPQKP